MYELGQIIEIKIRESRDKIIMSKARHKSVFNHVVGHVITLDGQ